MKGGKYYPFRDRNHVVRVALCDAISWQESRQDAGCDSTEEDQSYTTRKIASYRKLLKLLGPSDKTAREQMEEALQGARIVSVCDLLRKKP